MRTVDDTQSSDKRIYKTTGKWAFQGILSEYIYVYVDINLKFPNKPVEQLDGVCCENTTNINRWH